MPMPVFPGRIQVVNVVGRVRSNIGRLMTRGPLRLRNQHYGFEESALLQRFSQIGIVSTFTRLATPTQEQRFPKPLGHSRTYAC